MPALVHVLGRWVPATVFEYVEMLPASDSSEAAFRVVMPWWDGGKREFLRVDMVFKVEKGRTATTILNEMFSPAELSYLSPSKVGLTELPQ